MTQARQLASLEIGQGRLRPVDAAPAALALLPGGERDAFGELRHLEGQRAVAVEAEGAAVEDQLVLAAALVDIDERQAGLDHAGKRHLLAHIGLALPIGRAVGRDQDFGAGFGQAFGDLLEPDVLADRQAEPDAAKADRTGQRPDFEDAQLVEDAVIGQFDLVAQASTLPPSSSATAL